MKKDAQVLIALKPAPVSDVDRARSHHESTVEFFMGTYAIPKGSGWQAEGCRKERMTYPLYPPGHPLCETFFIVNGVLMSDFDLFDDGEFIEYWLELA